MTQEHSKVLDEALSALADLSEAEIEAMSEFYVQGGDLATLIAGLRVLH